MIFQPETPTFEKEQATQVKGVAVVMLLLHHLFLGSNPTPWYTDVLGGYNGDVEFFCSSIGKLCVPLFFLLSGYGLWIASESEAHLWRSTFRRLYKIYLTYFLAVLSTIAIIYLLRGTPPLLSWRQGIKTFLGINTSIDGSWWFFIIYVEMLLLTPPAVLLTRRFSWRVLLVCSVCLYLFSEQNGLSPLVQAMHKIGLSSMMYNHIQTIHFWSSQLYFFTGFCLAASGYVISWLRFIASRIHQDWQRHILGICLLGGVLFLRYSLVAIGQAMGILPMQKFTIFEYTRINTQLDFILGPLSFFALVLVCCSKQLAVLDFIGRHSAGIWLIHGVVLIAMKNALGPYLVWSPSLLVLLLLISSLYALASTWLQRKIEAAV